MKAYYRYSRDVLSSKIVAGKYIKLACERFERDLKDERFEFREDLVDKVINFTSLFKNYSGFTAGSQVKLMDWQTFLFANIFGFYYKGTDRRRIRSCYLQISRKSGKSFLAAMIALIFFLIDNESDPQVLFTATSREQAKICFDQAKSLLRQIDPTEKITKINNHDITLRKLSGRLKVMAADAKRLDGWSPSLAIIDEYHQHVTSEVRDVMNSGQGARKNPLELIITTAGYNLNSPCKIHRDVCAEILERKKTDESLFALIFELDEGDDWQDATIWRKAVPCLDVTVTTEYLASQIQTAINNPSKLVDVKTKNLNMWVENNTTKWINESTVKAVTQSIDWNSFRDQNIYIGVDLSSTRDLTAVSYMFFDHQLNKLIFKVQYFLPESALSDRGDLWLYAQARRKGDLIITEGNVVDYNKVKAEIDKVRDIGTIRSVAYDKYNATQWAINMMDDCYNMLEYSQSLSSFNKPTKEFERLILSEQIVIDSNILTPYCFTNVDLKVDYNGNCKPDKSKQDKKIDGVIAILQSVGGYLEDGNSVPQIFV